MSLLSNELVGAQFIAGIETINFQEESKIELIFLRLVEHEMRIRSESEPGSAITDVEKQKLVSVLNNVNSVEQVCLTRPFYPVSKHLMNGYLAKIITKSKCHCIFYLQFD